MTGGSGFVGSKVVEAANLLEWKCSYQSRSPQGSLESYTISHIDGSTDWFTAIDGVDVVIHSAARVHQMTESQSSNEVLDSYREVNALGTLNLARQSAQRGVKRFIFISSVKVNGEQTQKSETFKATVTNPPTDPYALSKYEAEAGLRDIAKESGMEVVIIRPPLVYGPGVRANFKTMMDYVYKGVPLPFGAINNRRSLVYIDNLVSLILTCCEHPAAANKTFLVSDNEDVSTTRLMKEIARCMEKSSRLLPISQRVIEAIAKTLGKSNLSARVCGNLQLDISDTLCSLSWKPPVTFEQGIEHTVTAYLANK